MAPLRCRTGTLIIGPKSDEKMTSNGKPDKNTTPNGHVNKRSSRTRAKDEVTTYNKSNNYNFRQCNGSTTRDHSVPRPYPKEVFEKPPILVKILTLVGFYILIMLGRVHDWFFKAKDTTDREGYAPILNKFESFYIRHVYRRIKYNWNTPVMGNPGSHITLKDVTTEDNGWTLTYPGTETTCLNLGSYNYLGFSENRGMCAEAAKKAIRDYGVACCSPRREFGTTPLHEELERLVAEFLDVEDAITFGMGFATNSLNLPALFDKECLVISDERNHASLIVGIRVSGAVCKVFKHNDVKDLENILIENINRGQTARVNDVYVPWKKIFIIVEGIYSMDGSICHLPEIIALKQKYKAYLYLDEAHSIGALGPRGRGVCDYYNCSSRDVDILMGTFTKSFGSAGGYIAGSKKVIDFFRVHSHAATYAAAMSAPVAAQIISSMKIIMGKEGNGEGVLRLKRLRSNTRYFRRRLHQMGLVVYGHEDSPVVPIVVYFYSKINACLNYLKRHKIATVGVGYPATPMFEARIRICLSAAHTKEELDYALNVLDYLADKLGMRYSKLPRELAPVEYECVES